MVTLRKILALSAVEGPQSPFAKGHFIDNYWTKKRVLQDNCAIQLPYADNTSSVLALEKWRLDK